LNMVAKPGEADATFKHMPHYQMKVVRYPPKSQSEDAETLGKFGVGEHSDTGFLSLLLQDDVGGLQAQTNAGEWTDVPPKTGTFVVNLGEMLQLATGGDYLATVHRVQSRIGSDSRYSTPFFFNPRLDTDITTLNMVAKPGEADATFQNGSPLLLQDHARGKNSKTHGGANQLFPVFGQNLFKAFARSHLDNVREHHADLLQFDGKLMLSKLEEV
jgi:isopenicillin N synthase-like dioxygenase